MTQSNVLGVSDGLSKMLRVTIFSLAVSPPKENLLLVRDAVGRGVGNVERNFAEFIMTLLQEKKYRGHGITMMLHAVRKNRASRRKSIVLVITIHIVLLDGRPPFFSSGRFFNGCSGQIGICSSICLSLQ